MDWLVIIGGKCKSNYSVVQGLTAVQHLGQNFRFEDNCIQIFHLERYIIRYTVENLVCVSPYKVVSECISDDILPQMEIWKIKCPVLFINGVARS